MRKIMPRIRVPIPVFLLSIFVIVFFIYACRKFDHQSNRPKVDNTERFFRISSDAHPAVQKVVKVMRKLNDSRKFINPFVEKQGFAIWEKAVVIPINSSARLSSEDYSVLIPLVWDQGDQVHSAIAAKVTEDSVFLRYWTGAIMRRIMPIQRLRV